MQIFGLRKSQATRAAERFFSERRVKVHFVDLAARPIARGELARFTQKFGLSALIDQESKAYARLNLAYLRLSDEGYLSRIEEHPELLRLPLVRAGKKLSHGPDPAAWAAMLED